eukprot:gb/GECG01016604.1/.p1 GENE.gb/GECG01016604.1/~~gb/GECG01016604.1/.p1  ORF type:complete len:448 (+),score=46.87 gb/GECG01016604.1/:1-1344(+)
MEVPPVLHEWEHCRNHTEQLCALWRSLETTPPCALIYGNSRAVDKSVLVQSVLQHIGRTFVCVNPEEVASEAELWTTLWGRLQDEAVDEGKQQQVLQDLQRLRNSNTVFLKTPARSFLEFIHYTDFRFRHWLNKPMIVMDDAEKVENLSRGMLRRLCGHEGSGFALALISTTSSAFQFAMSRGEMMLPCVHLPAYSLETTIELVHQEVKALADDTDTDIGLEESLASFVSHTSQVLYPACADDVPMLVNTVWKLLKEHTGFSNAATATTTHLKQLHQRLLYLRKWLYQQPPTLRGDADSESRRDDHTETELPFLFKYMLIAAYLASHNPPDTDIKFFTRASSSAKRRTSSKRPNDKPDESLPRSFQVDRLLAIFFGLLAANEGVGLSKTVSSAEIQAQIASMVAVGMLSSCGSGDLSKPRYRSNVGFAVVQRVSEQLKFSIGKFLAS